MTGVDRHNYTSHRGVFSVIPAQSLPRSDVELGRE